MRTLAVLLGSVFLSVVMTYASFAATDKCPASALKASTAVWSFGALHIGETRTAQHPCGRQITCTAGKFGPPKELRQCHWN